MTVRVDTPQLQVTLKKVVRNQSGKSVRYQGAQTEFDLTRWLTEESSVSVTRQINSPAGSFHITLTDRVVVHGATMDSLYGIVEPMDVVEIRMARRPHEYAKDGKVGLPLVFRGIVSTIGRDEAMGQDGKPRRTITIAGQDWGKFFQIIQNRWYKGASLASDWMSAWRMQVQHGIAAETMEAGDIVASLLEKVGNKFISDLKVGTSSIPLFTWDVSGADPVDKVFSQGFQALPGGSLWTYLQTFGDLGPFYELFIDDEEAAPKVVYRKPGFLTAYGEPVYGVRPDAIIVEPVDITRLSISRSDADVANWWWIDHQRLLFLTGQRAVRMQLGADGNPFLPADHPNASPAIYGNRPMEVVSHHGYMSPGGDAAVVDAQTQNYLTYCNAKRLKLQAANKDNVVFESGQITMAGNEAVKVGRNLLVDRNGQAATYYVQGVTHTFQPYRAFTTQVNFIRGTGFVVRSSNDEIGTRHPYLSEIGRGPYEDRS